MNTIDAIGDDTSPPIHAPMIAGAASYDPKREQIHDFWFSFAV
jgi:hypothetical protein